VMHELQHLRDSDRRAQRFRRDIHPI
jgi:hypothetical protein